VVGVLPFCAIGLMVGSFVSGQAAPAIVNVIYLPMAFLSGLWVPLQFLPKMVQGMAPLWPPFHLSQLAYAALGMDSLGSAGNHVAALAGVTLLCFMLAMRRLGNMGLRLMGGTPRAGLSLPLRRVTTLAVVWVSIGLIIAGVMGGKAKVIAAPASANASTASASTDGSAATDTGTSGGPVGVAAPAGPLVFDFDAGSAQAPYGKGWTAVGDDMRGGNSTASQQLVDGGANGTHAALEVKGAIGDGIQYPFAGTTFFPVNTDKGTIMDYRGRTELRFSVRGDGRQYTVMFLGPAEGVMPAMYGFTAGTEWEEVRIPLKDMAGLDLARTHGILVGSMGPVGEFHFEIDGIELR
jgi:hypothetical protein